MDASEKVEWDYPPLLILIYALFPSTLIERRLRLFSVFSDLPCLLSIGGMAWLIDGQVNTGLVAMALYSCTPSIATQSMMLTARFLSIMLFTVSAGLVLYYLQTGEGWAIVLAVIAGAFLLLSNALAMQAWVFVVTSLAVLSLHRWVWLGYLVASVAACYLIAGRVAWRVHRGLIVKLWVLKKYRMDDIHISQYDLLQKVRGISAATDDSVRRNLRIAVRSILLLDYPFFWVFALTILNRGSRHNPRDVYIWLAVLVVCHIIIDSIPALRFIGPAHRYLSYAFLPAGILVAGELFDPRNGIAAIILSVLLLLAGLALAVSRRSRLQNDNDTRVEVLQKLGECLRDLPVENILALPMSVNAALGYFSEKKFLHGWASRAWGVGPRNGIYPVIERPLVDIIEQFGIEALVIKKDYARIEELNIPSARKVSDLDGFEVYVVSR